MKNDMKQNHIYNLYSNVIICYNHVLLISNTHHTNWPRNETQWSQWAHQCGHCQATNPHLVARCQAGSSVVSAQRLNLIKAQQLEAVAESKPTAAQKPNFPYFFYSPSPSPLYNYLHFIYTICIYLNYFFHCASIIFPWSPASSQHPGARPQASLSVHFGAPSGPHELGRYLCSCASSRWPKAWPGTQGCPNLSGSSCAGSRWF